MYIKCFQRSTKSNEEKKLKRILPKRTRSLVVARRFPGTRHDDVYLAKTGTPSVYVV